MDIFNAATAGSGEALKISITASVNGNLQKQTP